MAKKTTENVEVTEKEVTLFERLFALNVNDKLEKKMNLSYLSWAWAWAEVKKIDPKAEATIHEFPLMGYEGVTVPYLQTPTGFFVKVSVKIFDQVETEWLPVMDNRNKTIEKPNAFDINKNTKRCLVKAIALHGLGLYVYAGEDLPEEAQQQKEEEKQQPKKQTPPQENKKQETKKETKKAEDLPQYNPISEKTISLISVFDEEIASKTGKIPFQPVQLLVKNPNFTFEDLGGLKEEEGEWIVKNLENWIKKLNAEA